MKMFVKAVKRAEFFNQEYERSGYETRSSWTTHLPVEIGLECAASEIADRARMALCTQDGFFKNFTKTLPKLYQKN